ncbi:hypothetical protein Nepgr_007762 [Nepenthes gracilis]|uniref:Uncharacterized protein n=1 Tax=Nepenthes gracilis TaxID=150966 RepID=A0AAD3XIK1_NEPGR|nr:hypothetical protein Nepgr_007762 [Nepenthes gracilis]
MLCLLTVFCSEVNAVDVMKLLLFIESYSHGIWDVHKVTCHGLESEGDGKWGSITPVTPYAACRVTEMKRKTSSLFIGSASKGVGIVTCGIRNVMDDYSNLQIGEKNARCGKYWDSVMTRGFDKKLSENEIFDALRNATL